MQQLSNAQMCVLEHVLMERLCALAIEMQAMQFHLVDVMSHLHNAGHVNSKTKPMVS